jgi:hypothetical protein
VPGERLYTLAEARAMIVPLGRLLRELQAARAVLTDHGLADTLSARAPGNGGGEEGTRFASAALTFSRGLDQIAHWGVVVRDLGTGICDFRARHEGRDVYLCWRLGEERLGFWHELDAGFAGRRPLEDGGPTA